MSVDNRKSTDSVTTNWVGTSKAVILGGSGGQGRRASGKGRRNLSYFFSEFF
jgi:hypothetical protein